MFRLFHSICFILLSAFIHRTTSISFSNPIGADHSSRGMNDLLRPHKYNVACVGDSITWGSGASNRNISSYPAILQSTLGHERFIVENFGLGSSTMLKATNKSYWDSSEFQSALHSNPDIVIIQLGTNDAKSWFWNEADYIRDYTEMIWKFQNLSTEPLVFVSIPPPMYLPSHGIRQDIVNDALPRVITAISASTGARLIDVYNALGGKELSKKKDFLIPGEEIRTSVDFETNKANDGCHPNDLGYADISNEVASVILKHIKLHRHSDKHHHKHHHVSSPLPDQVPSTSGAISTRLRHRFLAMHD